MPEQQSAEAARVDGEKHGRERRLHVVERGQDSEETGEQQQRCARGCEDAAEAGKPRRRLRHDEVAQRVVVRPRIASRGAGDEGRRVLSIHGGHVS
eukprot:3444797-Prymnesium_polylepis.2